jgi:hypothetical protein
MQGERNDNSPARAAPPKLMSSSMMPRALLPTLKQIIFSICFEQAAHDKRPMTGPKVFLAALLLLAGQASAEVRLLMIEAPGCAWCARWHAELGDIYDKTDEGRIAPLLRADKGAVPPDVTLARPAILTPTFVLLDDGVEVGRIEGYPGEHFFWPLLDRLIGELPSESREDPSS